MSRTTEKLEFLLLQQHSAGKIRPIPTHSEGRDGTGSGDDRSSPVPYGGRNPRLTAEVQGQAMAYFA